jgi:hypothetical protein
MTNPAAGTESIGLPGQLFPVKFFAALLINFIMTGQLRFIYRDLQKTLQHRDRRQQTIPAGR